MQSVSKFRLRFGWLELLLVMDFQVVWPVRLKEKKEYYMAKKHSRDGGNGGAHDSHGSQGFSFRAPEAISVQLVGDFTHWQEKPISLKKDTGGVWHAQVPLPPGVHHYRFLVDGEWRDDPECSLRVENPFGGQNMTRKVS
jgi:1,4-alpha-glucan branching enzyme